MKKFNIILAVFMCSLGLLAFSNLKLGRIVGKITPVEGVNSILLISGTDTLKTEIAQGIFKFGDLKQGVYTLWVKGIVPYKDSSIRNVAVKDSSTTDVGEIKLQQ